MAFKKIIWLYKCVAYYNYRWQVMVDITRKANNEFGAVATTSATLFINLFNINLALKYIWAAPILLLGASKILIGTFAIALLYLNYIYLMKGKKFEFIKKEFENCTVKEDKIRKTAVSIYTLSSFAILFTLLIATGRK